jgi:PilZ domain
MTNSGWSGEERRRELRSNVSLGAELEVGGRTYLGEIQAISLQGAYLRFMDADPFPHEGTVLLLPHGFPEGIEVAIRRKVPDESGLVRGVGLEFLALESEARAFVESLVSSGGS